MKVTFDYFLNNLEKFLIEEIDISSMYKGGTSAKRSFYSVNGVQLVYDEISPYNFLKTPYERTTIDVIVSNSIEIPKGFFLEQMYCECGFGYLQTENMRKQFHSLKMAFEYATKHTVK